MPNKRTDHTQESTGETVDITLKNIRLDRIVTWGLLLLNLGSEFISGNKDEFEKINTMLEVHEKELTGLKKGQNDIMYYLFSGNKATSQINEKIK